MIGTPATHTPVLVEHSNHGNTQFDRLGDATFSDEDQVTLRHVAAVLAGLVVIALTLGVISVIA